MRRLGGGVLAGVASLALSTFVGCSEPEAPAQVAVETTETTNTITSATSEAENKAPVIDSVRLSPRDVKPGDLLSASVEAHDPEGAAIEIGYTWHFGGVRLAGGDSGIEVPTTAKRGDEMRVTIVATDSKSTSEPEYATAEVGNTPPAWQKFKLKHDSPLVPGGEIAVVAIAYDHDGDEVNFETHWYVNKRLQPTETTAFDTTKLKRGDVIFASVLARDRTHESEERKTESIEIANAEPTIVSAPGQLSNNGTFQYQLEVEDPDGDRRFRYSLNSSPPGMEIDGSFGKVTWQATEELAGTHNVEVVATDLYGGAAHQQFELTVSVRSEEASPASPAADGESVDED